LNERGHRARIASGEPVSVSENEGGSNRWLAPDLNMELVKRGAPIHTRNRDRRTSEFVGGKRTSASPEQKEG
jgi:hypothetical protein